MAQRHQYIGIENLGLSASQKQTLVQALQGLGKADADPNPSNRNHWRVRLDNEAVIFEAVFEDGDLTIAAIKQRLADIFGVAVANITNTTPTNPIFVTRPSTVVVFSYNSAQRLRTVVFGGTSATREQSRIEAAGYIAANAAQWE